MDYAIFLADVRERGGFADRADAEDAVRIVLGVLGRRLGTDAAHELAAQLPAQAGEMLVSAAAESAPSWSMGEFVTHVSVSAGTLEQEAAMDAEAVLSAVSDVLTGEQLASVLSRLPDDYAGLFDGGREST
ncbi:DUF2267 domain-containing protein [Streptomyces sp. KR80]|uniref:DUF2267 domain-containing protein n=1 Tax=Streptomyces sp. KR80 TaxID=3457426 RepID=UPI003FD01463